MKQNRTRTSKMLKALMSSFFFSCVIGFANLANAADASLKSAIEEYYDDHLYDLFVWFHQNPELSFLENNTAARLAQELRDLGVEVTEGLGRTGLVGIIENGPGPMVMIRADMDGLPVLENNGLGYASRARQINLAGEEMPVMHACGHDMHMTSLVGTAKMLIDNRDSWSGTVMLVGQPAEEIINGAKEMIADGLYERWGVPDYGIGLHVSSGLLTGRVSVREGITNSSTDSVDIKMRGIGGHGAYPQQTVDPIYMSSQLVIALQGIISRQISPQAPAVITVGSLHAGSKHNIISNEADLQLTVRTDSEEVRGQVLQAIEDTAMGIARMNGIPDDLMPIVSVGFESTATNVNDDATVQKLLPSWTEQLGYNPLITTPRPGMGGEDFAEYGQTEHDVPTVFFSVGGTPADVLAEIEAGNRGVPPHHSEFFFIDPESVKAGVEATYTAAIELLNNG